MIVYEITCLADGRRYVGSTIHTVEKRWKGHLSYARIGMGEYLHDAIREHGAAAFVQREVACARTEPELRALERVIIKQEGTIWPNGLNGWEGISRRYGERVEQLNPWKITPALCRSGRAALDWSIERLAKAANMSAPTVSSFERGLRRKMPGHLKALEQTFEAAGIGFGKADGGKVVLTITAADGQAEIAFPETWK